MRHRTDANQNEIVKALKKIGCSVYIIGRPVDLVVGRNAFNWLVDVKSEKGTLTPFQKDFFRDWRGQVRVVRSPEEAVKLVTESYGR